MERLNINNMFPESKIREDKPLDVRSLYYSTEKRRSKKVEFKVEDITKRWEEKRKKVVQQYKKVYNMCLNAIKNSNKMNKFDIVYEVPIAVYMCPDYSSVECLEYIEEKLKKLYLDTLIINHFSIFISWVNIKENKEAADKK